MTKTDAIVTAAGKRFRYYGVGKTTMQEIAADAGVAVGTLYLYFNNKDELVAACAETFIERHHQQAAAVLASDISADEKLRQYVVARFREAEDVRTSSPHAAEIHRAVLRVKPDRLRDEGMMMWRTVCEILKSGIARRVFAIADVEQDAKILMYAIAPFFPGALVEPLFIPTENDLMEVVNWYLRTWRTNRSPGKTPRASLKSTRRTRPRPRVS